MLCWPHGSAFAIHHGHCALEFQVGMSSWELTLLTGCQCLIDWYMNFVQGLAETHQTYVHAQRLGPSEKAGQRLKMRLHESSGR